MFAKKTLLNWKNYSPSFLKQNKEVLGEKTKISRTFLPLHAFKKSQPLYKTPMCDQVQVIRPEPHFTLILVFCTNSFQTAEMLHKH